MLWVGDSYRFPVCRSAFARYACSYLDQSSEQWLRNCLDVNIYAGVLNTRGKLKREFFGGETSIPI
jgi:hypothetical protein